MIRLVRWLPRAARDLRVLARELRAARRYAAWQFEALRVMEQQEEGDGRG